MQTKREAGAVRSEIVDWRREQLRASGFSTALAARIASDHRIDLHVLIELVERGCPPVLAARILQPLEDAEERA